MQPIGFHVAALAIALLACVYRTYRHVRRRKERVLRRRVAYMLWVMAQRVDRPSGLVPRHRDG